MKTASCPDCGNACSLTATKCSHCGRIMKPDDLSESNLVKPVDYSKSSNILIYTLAVISGIIGFFFASLILGLLGLGFGVGFWGEQIISGLVFFITFLVLGTLFGFVWNNLGWKLGLLLASFIIIVYGFLFLLGVVSSVFSGNITLTIIFTAGIAPKILLVAGSCVGAYIGAEYKRRTQTNNGVV